MIHLILVVALLFLSGCQQHKPIKDMADLVERSRPTQNADGSITAHGVEVTDEEAARLGFTHPYVWQGEADKVEGQIKELSRAIELRNAIDADQLTMMQELMRLQDQRVNAILDRHIKRVNALWNQMP